MQVVFVKAFLGDDWHPYVDRVKVLGSRMRDCIDIADEVEDMLWNKDWWPGHFDLAMLEDFWIQKE